MWQRFDNGSAIGVGVIGVLLAWTGWTGPELLSKIGDVPLLAFVGSDAFRASVLVVGLAPSLGCSACGGMSVTGSAEQTQIRASVDP